MSCPVDGSRQCDPICSGCLSFLDAAVRMYAQVGQELFELPSWAFLRRRKALGWRRHYAARIADELEAAAFPSGEKKPQKEER